MLKEGLKHYLLNISQLWDKSHKIVFESNYFFIIDIKDNSTKFTDHEQNNIYATCHDDFLLHLKLIWLLEMIIVGCSIGG